MKLPWITISPGPPPKMAMGKFTTIVYRENNP